MQSLEGEGPKSGMKLIQITMSFSMICPNIYLRLSIRKRLGLQTNFHNQGQIAKFLWVAWANKTGTNKRSLTWRGRFRNCRVRNRRLDSKTTPTKTASPLRMGWILGSHSQTSSPSLDKVASWIRKEALNNKIGLTRTWSSLMTQPLVSLNSIQYMQDSTQIKDSQMLTWWVKKKWRLTVFSAKTLCRRRKSFQQFWAWATNRTTCTSTMKETQYLLPTKLKSMSSKTNK